MVNQNKKILSGQIRSGSEKLGGFSMGCSSEVRFPVHVQGRACLALRSAEISTLCGPNITAGPSPKLSFDVGPALVRASGGRGLNSVNIVRPILGVPDVSMGVTLPANGPNRWLAGTRPGVEAVGGFHECIERGSFGNNRKKSS